MIELRIKDKCHNCDQFEPTVKHHSALWSDNTMLCQEIAVVCVHEDLCDMLQRRIREEVKREYDAKNTDS